MIYENTPRLETERLILRKLEETPDDLNAMFAILSDREANTFLALGIRRRISTTSGGTSGNATSTSMRLPPATGT